MVVDSWGCWEFDRSHDWVSWVCGEFSGSRDWDSWGCWKFGESGDWDSWGCWEFGKSRDWDSRGCWEFGESRDWEELLSLRKFKGRVFESFEDTRREEVIFFFGARGLKINPEADENWEFRVIGWGKERETEVLGEISKEDDDERDDDDDDDNNKSWSLLGNNSLIDSKSNKGVLIL